MHVNSTTVIESSTWIHYIFYFILFFATMKEQKKLYTKKGAGEFKHQLAASETFSFPLQDMTQGILMYLIGCMWTIVKALLTL